MKVVVVGAGIFGASVAYHLAREGAEVVGVDDGRAGRATAAGAGIVSPWSMDLDEPDWYRLASTSARYYPELLAELAELGEGDVSYKRVGTLSVSQDAAVLDATEARVRRRREAAPEAGTITRLSPQECRTLFPPLNPAFSAVHVSGGARVDGRQLAEALRRAATARGARFEAGSATLLVDGSRVAGVRFDGRELRADKVVVAAGAWANELLSPLGVRLRLSEQRGQIVHFRLPGADTSRWPVISPLNGYYMLAFDDSRVILGATREDGVGFDYRVTAAGQRDLLTQALALAPGLADATVLETRVGFRPMPPDLKPLLGELRGIDGLLVADGLGASGLTTAPYAGKLVAGLALGRAGDFDLAPYAADRARAPA